MFTAEMNFMESDGHDFTEIAKIFHANVIIHEPESLPYAGDWQGHESLGQLFEAMHDAWSSIDVENLEAVMNGSGSAIFMCCTLNATARKTGREVCQPFANLLRIQEGLIVEGTPFYHDTAALIDALE